LHLQCDNSSGQGGRGKRHNRDKADLAIKYRCQFWIVTDRPLISDSLFIPATQKGCPSRSCILRLPCWLWAGDAHGEQGTADKQLPALVTETGHYTEGPSSLPEEGEVVL